MTVIRKTPARKAPATVPSDEPLVPVKRVRKQGTTAKPATPEASSRKLSGTLIPVQPEPSNPPSDLRTRLSKAFSRPLDKKLKKATLILDSFTFPKAEYAQLSQLKKRLIEQGVPVKKNQLVRAGLILLAALDDSNLKSIVAKVPPLD